MAGRLRLLDLLFSARQATAEIELDDDEAQFLNTLDVPTFSKAAVARNRTKSHLLRKRQRRVSIETSTGVIASSPAGVAATSDESDDNCADCASEGGGETLTMTTENQRTTDPLAPPLVTTIEWEDAIVWDGDSHGDMRQRRGSLAASLAQSKRRRASLAASHNAAAKLRKQAKAPIHDPEPSTAVPEGSDAPTGFSAENHDSAVQPIGKRERDAAAHRRQNEKKAREDEEEARRTEVALKVPAEVATSIFRPRNEFLVTEDWLDDIVWDDDESGTSTTAAAKPEYAGVIVDLNDEHILHPATVERPVFMRQLHRIKQLAGRNRVATFKLREMEDKLEEKRQLRLKGGVPLPNSHDDPFNISADAKYRTKDGTAVTDLSLKKCIGKRVQGLDHSNPGRHLHKSCFRTSWNAKELRQWHRPLLKDTSRKKGDRRPIESFVEILAQKQLQKDEKPLKDKVNAKWRLADLTALEGHEKSIILAEYCEQYPLIMQNRGMCTLIRNYYKQSQAADVRAPKLRHGATVHVGVRDASPFLGNLQPKESLQSFENNLFRAPIYEHKMSMTDFLVVRTIDVGTGQDTFVLRRLPVIYTVGQICPKLEVPSPNSKDAKAFPSKRILAHIKRIFLKKGAYTCIEDMRNTFPTYNEPNIRNQLRSVGDYNRTRRDTTKQRGNLDNGQWELKEGLKLTAKEVDEELTPEDVCLHEAMLAAEQRLKDYGYGARMENEVEVEEDDKQLSAADELRLAPWRLTQDFLNCMRDKCLIYVTGKAEPTGNGSGFSYLRQPHKAVASNAPESKFTPGGYTAPKKQEKLAGTLRDLRRLPLKIAKTTLVNHYGYDISYLDTLGRWQVIDLVKVETTKFAKATGQDHRFARDQRSSAAELEGHFKSECQRIFATQNHQLRDEEIHTTDEDDSDDSADDLMQRQFEDDLMSGLDDSRHHEAIKEKQEKLEYEKLKAMFEDDSQSMVSTATSARGGGVDATTVASTAVSSATGVTQAKRAKLVITRFKEDGGKTFETVSDPRIIDAYLKAKAVGDGMEANKQNMRRQKRRIKDQKKRLIKKMQERREQQLLDDGAPSPTPSATSVKEGKQLHIVCGKCGQIGHMQTNKKCPLYGKEKVKGEKELFMEQYEKNAEKVLAEGVTDVDGTTVTINTARLKQAKRERNKGYKELERRRMDKQRKINKQQEQEMLAFKPAVKRHDGSIRVKKNPEVVLNSIISSIIHKMKTLRIKANKQGYIDWFDRKVDIKKYPNYLDYVKNPIDLNAMNGRAKHEQYKSRAEFVYDVRLLCTNALLYNGWGIVYDAAKELREEAFKQLTKSASELAEAEKELGTNDIDTPFEIDITKEEDKDASVVANFQDECRREGKEYLLQPFEEVTAAAQAVAQQ